jgi:hypothetical protein
VCCGRNRMQQRNTAPRPPGASPYAGGPPPPREVSFVYVGNTGMTVQGPVSGREYRFDRPGARVEVDARDRILLASLRQLRQVI